MKKYWKYTGVLIVLSGIVAMSATSCRKKHAGAATGADTIKGNYFSINQFLVDEWNTFAGEPFMIAHSMKEGEKTDSNMTNSDSINWAPMVKLFTETDISDRKYLGHYKFSQFDDNADQTHNFFYEANEDEEDLYTRKLLITIDRFTTQVKGIYIETEKKTIFDDKVQKLYYKPLKTVQIQTDYKPLLGSKKYTVEQYEFLR